MKQRERLIFSAFHDADRGTVDQAEESLRRAIKIENQLLSGQVYIPSDNLTDEENVRYRDLMRNRHFIDEDDNLFEIPLPEAEEDEYEWLESKAQGRPFESPTCEE